MDACSGIEWNSRKRCVRIDQKFDLDAAEDDALRALIHQRPHNPLVLRTAAFADDAQAQFLVDDAMDDRPVFRLRNNHGEAVALQPAAIELLFHGERLAEQANRDPGGR